VSITREQFLLDVADHKMTVVHEAGLHRHLHFGAPGTSDMHFQIVTFPGHLVYVGDMGSYTFQRLEDMFAFFRTKPAHKESPHINLGYWAEKLEAVDRHGSYEEWEPEEFKRYVIRDFRDHCRDNDVDHETRREIWQELKDDVFSTVDEGEHACREAARNFSLAGFEFYDSWEWDCTEYTLRFVWACYAIAWAVMQYDEAMALPIMNTEEVMT
jgi:hypothetical protein